MKDWNKNYQKVSEPKIGAKYHVSWTSKPGMVWVCIEIHEHTVTLQTPKSRKKLRGVNKSDLLHIKKDAIQL